MTATNINKIKWRGFRFTERIAQTMRLQESEQSDYEKHENETKHRTPINGHRIIKQINKCEPISG